MIEVKDRVVEHPYRYQLIAVQGEEGVYDIVPVSGTITEAGTPINRALFKALQNDIPQASFLAFAGNVNADMLDAAFGKNNEDRINALGKQIAMYAWFKGDVGEFAELKKHNTFKECATHAIAEIVGSQAIMALIENSPFAKDVYSLSYVCYSLDLDAASYQDWEDFANSEVAMTALVNSETILDFVFEIESAITAITSSEIASNIVANSENAMDIITASQELMDIFSASDISMTALASSNVSMTKISESSIAMTALYNNREITESILIDSTVAISVFTANAAPAVSQTGTTWSVKYSNPAFHLTLRCTGLSSSAQSRNFHTLPSTRSTTYGSTSTEPMLGWVSKVEIRGQHDSRTATAVYMPTIF